MIAEDIRPAALHGTHLLEALERQPPDALLGLIGLYRQDLGPTKIDPCVGVCRDHAGETPIMLAIKAAE